MTEQEKIEILKELEPIIDYNVRKYFNYRMADYQDLMQEARTMIYASLDKYVSEKSTLSTFCQIIIKNNLVCHSIKLYKVWDKTIIDSEHIESIADDEEDKLNNYYKRLDNIKDVYNLRFTNIELRFIECLVDKKSFKEIEKELDINTNYRVQLAFQVKKKIQAILQEEGI